MKNREYVWIASGLMALALLFGFGITLQTGNVDVFGGVAMGCGSLIFAFFVFTSGDKG